MSIQIMKNIKGRLAWLLGVTFFMVVPNSLWGQSASDVPPPLNTVSVGFRIDSDIYSDESKPPIAQHKTLFTETQAIDLDSQGTGVVILDFPAGTLTLMDNTKRIQTMLELANVEAMLQDALAQLPSSSSPQATRDANQLLVIKDETVEYQIKTEQPATSLLATRYSEFADATTKIVAIFPPYKPPQLRLELNRVLREAKELPMVTTRTTSNKGSKSVVTARLLIKPQLDEEDKKDIRIVNNNREQFKFVSSNEYFGTK